jgi:hypothetical protein
VLYQLSYIGSHSFAKCEIPRKIRSGFRLRAHAR